MGNCCFRKTSSAIYPKNVTLLLVGLDNSGKTTIAKRLAGEPIDSVVPTIGFSVLTIRHKGCKVSIYDLGGGPQIRNIWPRYYADVHGVIFVVDASDENRMEECRHVLRRVLENEQISRKPILLLANKQDLEGALDEIDVVDRLNLEKMVNELKCPTLVELSSAVQFSRTIDVGLDNGYKWLIRSIIRDYPTLNNRVLKDFAKQEEESRVHLIKTWTKNENKEEIFANQEGEHFKPIESVLEETKKFSEITEREKKLIPEIPQFINKASDATSTREIYRLSERSSITNINTKSYENVTFNFFQSEMELLKDVANQSFKNFMVRPKSSCARLNGARTEKKKKRQKRTQLKKLNKMVPNFIVPLTDFSNSNQKNFQVLQGVNSEIKISEISLPSLEDNVALFDENNLENTNPFVVTHNLGKTKISEQELSRLFGEKVSCNKEIQASKFNTEDFDNLKNKKYTHSKNFSLSKVKSFHPMKVNKKINSNEIILDVLDVTQAKK